MRLGPRGEFWGTLVVAKRNGRLIVKHEETGNPVYEPPDFVREGLTSRDPLVDLAARMTELQRRDITIIMEFEDRWTKRGRRRS